MVHFTFSSFVETLWVLINPYKLPRELSREILLFFFTYPWKFPEGNFTLGILVTQKTLLPRGQQPFTLSFSMDSWHHVYTDIISFQSWMIGLLLTSSTNPDRRMKSSFVKCLEHIDEFRVNSNLARVCFTKPIHFFPRFLTKGIACRTITFCTSGKVVHPPTRHLPGTFQVQYRECDK